jgi:hypothetical protein
MSSVRPTRGKADNNAGPKRPLLQRLAPRVRISSWPGAHDGSNKEAEDTCAVVTPPLITLDPFERGKALIDRNADLLRRRKSETALA